MLKNKDPMLFLSFFFFYFYADRTEKQGRRKCFREKFDFLDKSGLKYVYLKLNLFHSVITLSNNLYYLTNT